MVTKLRTAHNIAYLYISDDQQAEEKKRFFKTTDGAKCILKEMALSSQNQSNETGYGCLRPYKKVFEKDIKFNNALSNAWEYR